jgi:hypothetical protein
LGPGYALPHPAPIRGRPLTQGAGCDASSMRPVVFHATCRPERSEGPALLVPLSSATGRAGPSLHSGRQLARYPLSKREPSRR